MDKNLHKENNFKTPEGFFDESVSKILSETVQKKESGFNVPEHYFNDLKSEILSKTVNQKQTKVVRLRWFYSAAAVAAAILVVGILIPPLTSQKPQPIQLSNQTKEILYESFIEEEMVLEELETESALEEYAFLMEINDEKPTKKEGNAVVNQQVEKKPVAKNAEVEQATETIYELFMENEDSLDYEYFELENDDDNLFL